MIMEKIGEIFENGEGKTFLKKNPKVSNPYCPHCFLNRKNVLMIFDSLLVRYKCYVCGLRYFIKTKPHSVMKDYAGMNYYAAKAMGFTPMPEKDEIFICETMKGKKRAETIKHEIFEAGEMKDGKKYWQAHKKALVAEKNPPSVWFIPLDLPKQNPRGWNSFNLPPDWENKPRKFRSLTAEEQKIIRKKFGSKLYCSFAYVYGKLGRKRRGVRKKYQGFFAYTHRAMSKPKKSPGEITKKEYNFICSTG